MNNVELTDDELSVIMTALFSAITTSKNFIKEHGEDSLNSESLQAIKDMKMLYKKLESNYY